MFSVIPLPIKINKETLLIKRILRLISEILLISTFKSGRNFKMDKFIGLRKLTMVYKQAGREILTSIRFFRTIF